MAHVNRVTPTGEIVHSGLRGAWMGNRGCLHRGEDEIVRPWRSTAWIICRLAYKDWAMPQWAPGRYTVLFFHDEAVALAAGHRPCALCRRDEYNAYRDAWPGEGRSKAVELDAVLHSERLGSRSSMPWAELPDGTFVWDGGPRLVLGERVVPWSSTDGYGRSAVRPATGSVEVLTPPSTVAALRAGYPVQIGVG